MNELKNRGVQDILIFAVDNLKGISEAITAAFPQSEIHACIGLFGQWDRKHSDSVSVVGHFCRKVTFF
jgi:hypothetical protein